MGLVVYHVEGRQSHRDTIRGSHPSRRELEYSTTPHYYYETTPFDGSLSARSQSEAGKSRRETSLTKRAGKVIAGSFHLSIPIQRHHILTGTMEQPTQLEPKRPEIRLAPRGYPQMKTATQQTRAPQYRANTSPVGLVVSHEDPEANLERE